MQLVWVKNFLQILHHDSSVHRIKGSGHVFNEKVQIKVSRCDGFLSKQLEGKDVLCGASSGSVCSLGEGYQFPDLVTDSADHDDG